MGCATCSFCCCCCSPKGASFFCTSVHIYLAMYLSVKWILAPYVNGLNDAYFQDERMRVLFPLLLVYLSIFLVIGCVNFIAVERESAVVLKWSMRAFLLLQISSLLTNLLLAFVFPELDNDLAVHRFYHVKFMILNGVSTSVYFYVIWRFIFSLENGIYEVHKKKKKCAVGTPSGCSPGHLDSRPTAPWSDSVDRLQHHQGRSESPKGHEEQSIPLKSTTPEPQPCSSKG